MAHTACSVNEIIMQQILDRTEVADQSQSVAVFSCGGIYIPHRGSRQYALYHIINTASTAEPVKVVTGARPRNMLHEVLAKESLN